MAPWIFGYSAISFMSPRREVFPTPPCNWAFVQPALSRQIQKLEDELGLALILRAGRQLELTEAGLLLAGAGAFADPTSRTNGG